MQRAGLIAGLERQKSFPLRGLNGGLIGRYVADHVYLERGRLVVEDVKSAFTARLPMYRWKKKAMKDNYGHEIREIT
jgi:hypothetical protein